MSILTDAQMKLRVSKDLERVETYLQQSLQTGAEDFNAVSYTHLTLPTTF